MFEKVKDLATSLYLPNHLKIPSHKELVEGLQELQIKYPTKFQLKLNGRSRKGKELVLAEIGHGDRVIAITAGAHSDEPTGIATSFYLIQNLLENEDFRFLTNQNKFVIHPMLDPDGAELNYSWASKAYSFKNFLKHSFRNNQPSEDCEHGIPANNAQSIRPELSFFKANVDPYKGRIDFYITLHTTNRLGGSIFILTEAEHHYEKIECLTQVCKNFGAPVIDLDVHGQYGIKKIAPGFLSAPSMAHMADQYKDKPEIVAQIKLPTYEYVEHHLGASFCLISELPHIIDKGLQDLKDSKLTLFDLNKQDLSKRKSRLPKLTVAIKELEKLGINSDNPWFKNSVYAEKFALAGIENEEKHLDRYKGLLAKNSDVAESNSADFLAELRLHQLYIKSLEGIAAHKEIYEKHNRAFDEIYAQFESQLEYECIPIETQVRIQTAMILSGLDL